MSICIACCRQRNKSYRLKNHKTAQSGQCQICSDTFKTLVVDHDHSNGKYRGLLCRRCNVMLGMAQDKSRVLLNAIKYLLAYYERVLSV